MQNFAFLKNILDVFPLMIDSMVVPANNRLVVYWTCSVCVVIFFWLYLFVDLTFWGVFSIGSILSVSIAVFYLINGGAQ